MIPSYFSNRLVFILSLLGLGIASFLFYEYNITGPTLCPTGQGCDIVRASSYSHFFGVPIPILGIVFYLTMAILSVVHSHDLSKRVARRLQLLVAIIGVAFGIYLTFLEAFVINAFCFWCVLSFTISIIILLIIVFTGKVNYDKRRL